MLVTLGMLCIGIAVFALVINPRSFVEVPSLDLGTLGRVGGETRELVNLQKLAIGIASAIADRCSSPAASSPGVTDTKIRGALAAQLWQYDGVTLRGPMPIDDLEEHPIRDTVGRRIAIDELAACAELRDRYPNEPRIKRPPAAIGRRVRGLPGATGAP